MRLNVKEDPFKDAVIHLAMLLGLLVHHGRPARTKDGWRTPIQGHAGYPDLTLAGAGGIIFAELKTATGRLSPEQKIWQARIEAAGGQYRLWRPAHMDQPHDGHLSIRDELHRLAKPDAGPCSCTLVSHIK